MTLKFNEKVINDGSLDSEGFKRARFIGYLSPYGEEIDYSNPFGIGGHDNNPTTDLFMKFFMNHEIYSNKDSDFYETPEDIARKEKDYTEINREELKNEYKKVYLKFKGTGSRWDLLKYDLLSFFLNCYRNDSFVEGFGKDCSIMSCDDFEEKVYCFILAERDNLYPMSDEVNYSNYMYRVPLRYDLNWAYNLYRKQLKLDKFKDVMVQYIGYHYVARIPRTIYTSEQNVYETFYNYLLNDFTIYQLPKMMFNEDEKKYIELPNPEFFCRKNEEILKEEINSIKRLIKKEDRYKYYR